MFLPYKKIISRIWNKFCDGDSVLFSYSQCSMINWGGVVLVSQGFAVIWLCECSFLARSLVIRVQVSMFITVYSWIHPLFLHYLFLSSAMFVLGNCDWNTPSKWEYQQFYQSVYGIPMFFLVNGKHNFLSDYHTTSLQADWMLEL